MLMATTSSSLARRVPALRGSLAILACALALAWASPSGAAALRTDGLMEVEGQPLFPIGLLELGTYSYPDWAQRIHDSGANIVWDIEIAYADTVPTCAQVMQAAAQGGWYLMVGSSDTFCWDDPATPEHEVDRMMYETPELDELLQCSAAYPGRLIAFANRDEPSWTISRHMIGDIDAAHVHWTYEQLRAAKPDALVAMNHAPAEINGDLQQWKLDLTDFARASDVTMFASYPYPAGPGTCTAYNVLGYPECTMDRLAVAADVVLGEINRPGQPLWMIVQAFKGIPLKEARWEAWASVVHGATGLFWAGWNWVHPLGNGEDNWPVTRQVMSEVSALQPFLVGAAVPNVYTDQPDVEARAFRDAQSRILIVAIARNGFSGQASIHLPTSAGGRITVLYEGRRVAAQGGWITDTFDGYEAHLYRYQGAQTSGPTDAPVVAGAVDRFALTTRPNPSAGPTTVRFALPQPSTVVLTVYDAAGRRVAVVGRGSYGAGTGEIVWNGRDDAGRDVAPGVYFLRGSTSRGETATARVLIRR
jgi:hypothetical protein